jgi:HEAT repeat protein
VVALAILAAGCGRAPQTPQAGGKPVGHWIEALKEREPRLRKRAAMKLGNIGATDPVVVPALARALKDADAGVRAEAALALERMGRKAEAAAEALRQTRQDPDPAVRESAERALRKVEGGR